MRPGTLLRIPTVSCENWYASSLRPSNSMGPCGQSHRFVLLSSLCDICMPDDQFSRTTNHYCKQNNICRYRSSYGESWGLVHEYRNRHGREGISVSAHMAELSLNRVKGNSRPTPTSAAQVHLF